MGIEKRQHQRLDIALEVHVRGKDKNGRQFEEATLSGDISSGGCSLLLSYDVTAGTELQLEFRRYVTGNQEPMLLPFRGKVVRATAVNQIQYTLGIQFLNNLFPIDVLER